MGVTAVLRVGVCVSRRRFIGNNFVTSAALGRYALYQVSFAFLCEIISNIIDVENYCLCN